ncbi:hypothetical protein ALC62_07215 [Cyphomyrmex costatus]|uniref:Uncharacterized protein n=1 Tax=Cyphomyrmex costatus TaxID=456900 RepID=A0A195CMH0_9HYME|nr:hypothetical protein ALC62_07215 [Cyphomyrmex costatus]
MWKVRKVEQQRESERRRRVHDEGGSYGTLTANIISGNPASCVEDRTVSHSIKIKTNVWAYCQRENAKSVNDESQKLNDQEFDYSYTFSSRKAIGRFLAALPPVFTGLKQRMASSSYGKIARKNCQTAVAIVYCPIDYQHYKSQVVVSVSSWFCRHE